MLNILVNQLLEPIANAPAQLHVSDALRTPLSGDSIEYRALNANDHPYSVIEQDARDVMATVMHILGRNAV